MKIGIENLSPLQRQNFNEAIDSYKSKNVVSSTRPPVLYIELTNNCNSRCDFCKGPNFVNIPSFNMSSKVFDVLLKDYVPYAVLVDLRGQGESLILPNFHDYVEKVAHFGCKIRLTTNLGCGTKKALDAIIENNVYISVSFDACEKSLYESIRKGVNYDTVIKNMDYLVAGFTRKGTLADNLRLSLCPLQLKNLDQVEKVLLFARERGISTVHISSLVASRRSPQLLSKNKNKTLQTLKRAALFAKNNKITLQFADSPFRAMRFSEKFFGLCCHPWLYALVKYSGQYGYCDHIIDSGSKHGNIISSSPEELWNGPRMQKIRESHLNKDFDALHNKCKKCHTKGRYSDHEHEIYPEFARWLVTEDDFIDKCDENVSFAERILRWFS